MSGNPAGRRKSGRSCAVAVRRILDPFADELVERCLEQALKGDVNALSACVSLYSAVLPLLRPTAKEDAQNAPTTTK